MRAALAAAVYLAGVMGPGVARSEEPVQLDPITVTRPAPNPLDASRERLRRLMEDAPSGGSAVPFRPDWTDTVAAWFVPPDPSFEERREARLANDWRFAEYGPEMEAYR